MDNIVGNAQAQSDFIDVMSSLTQGWLRRNGNKLNPNS
jgi:hypothetical protein